MGTVGKLTFWTIRAKAFFSEILAEAAFNLRFRVSALMTIIQWKHKVFTVMEVIILVSLSRDL